MQNLEKLTWDIIQYFSDNDHYEIVDNYGNIETDSNARKKLFEDVYKTLSEKPQDVTKTLKEDKRDLEFEVDYKKDIEYRRIVNLIKRVEKTYKTPISEKIKIAKNKPKENNKKKDIKRDRNITL